MTCKLIQEVVTLVTSQNGIIVLPACKQKEAQEAKERILATYKIPSDRSPDLLAPQ